MKILLPLFQWQCWPVCQEWHVQITNRAFWMTYVAFPSLTKVIILSLGLRRLGPVQGSQSGLGVSGWGRVVTSALVMMWLSWTYTDKFLMSNIRCVKFSSLMSIVEILMHQKLLLYKTLDVHNADSVYIHVRTVSHTFPRVKSAVFIKESIHASFHKLLATRSGQGC